MRKIWIIIRREFLERVRTRWFVVSTILGPVFMAAVLVLPVMVATRGGRERSVAVVDLTTGGFGERLAADLDRSQPIRAVRVAADVADLESVADSLAGMVRLKTIDGFLIVSDEALADGRAEYRGINVSSPRDMQILSKYLEEAALTERLTRAGVDPDKVRQARVEMHLRTTMISGIKGSAESGEGSFVLAYAMWFVLYIAIVVYGVSVMGSVVEEKTSRVIEVLISSVRPFQLMSGKIAGVGGVGLFQLLIWGACSAILIDRQKQIMRVFGLSAEAAGSAIPHVSWITGGVFFLFFILGYFLYAAMFAAVASMSSTESEARQAQTPVVMLLVVPSVMMIGILNDPGGTLATTLGLIPFFSPIVMPVRWAAAPVPFGELAASLAILAVTVVAVTWVASRIYRVGILMYGKRPTVRELLRWVRTT